MKKWTVRADSTTTYEAEVEANTQEELKLWIGMIYNNRGMGIAPMYLQRFMQFCEQNNLTDEAGYNVFKKPRGE